jgi:predicted transcriptional regulator
MTEAENVSLTNVSKRLQELKLKLEEQGWKINELLNYIETHRKKYKDAILRWDEKQIHFLYLALEAPNSSREAIKEISKYHYVSEKDASSERSRGLFQAFKSISDVRTEDLGEKMYDQYFKWGLVYKICIKLGYYNENKSFTVEALVKNEFFEFIETINDISENEKRLIKESINRFYKDKNI